MKEEDDLELKALRTEAFRTQKLYLKAKEDFQEARQAAHSMWVRRYFNCEGVGITSFGLRSVQHDSIPR
jgi:hypothetical protein